MDSATPRTSDETISSPVQARRHLAERQITETSQDRAYVRPELDQTSNDELDRDLEVDKEFSDSEKPRDNIAELLEESIVNWDGPDDPENPQNWSQREKWIVTIAMGTLTFCITFSSSVLSAATDPIAELFGASAVVSTLPTSLFVLVRATPFLYKQSRD